MYHYYNDNLNGKIDKDSMVDDEQPFALRGGGDSRINKPTKKKKLTKEEISSMQEQQWEDMLADVE